MLHNHNWRHDAHLALFWTLVLAGLLGRIVIASASLGHGG